MMKLLRFTAGALLLAGLAACDDDEAAAPGRPPFEEAEARHIVFTEAKLLYDGDVTEAGSDRWVLRMTTDGVRFVDGYRFEGTGQAMVLDINATPGDGTDPAVLAGAYASQSGNLDFSPFTYSVGVMWPIEFPTGEVAVPIGSYFVDSKEGEGYVPDLIRDSGFKIEANDDGTFTVTGSLVGTTFLKRNFTYRGRLAPESDPGIVIPNSTLEKDLEITGLKHIRMVDRGDWFYKQDESYRMFEVVLSDEGIVFEHDRAKGDGRILRTDLLVAWSADPADGIPAGEYPMIRRTADGSGILGSDIVPGRSLAGRRGKFLSPNGTWYQRLSGGLIDDYACIDDGTVVVERGADGSHTITFNLKDDADPWHRVEAVFTTTEPIPVVK